MVRSENKYELKHEAAITFLWGMWCSSLITLLGYIFSIVWIFFYFLSIKKISVETFWKQRLIIPRATSKIYIEGNCCSTEFGARVKIKGKEESDTECFISSLVRFTPNLSFLFFVVICEYGRCHPFLTTTPTSTIFICTLTTTTNFSSLFHPPGSEESPAFLVEFIASLP